MPLPAMSGKGNGRQIRHRQGSDNSSTSLPRVVQRSPVTRPRAATRKPVQPQEIPIPARRFPAIPNVQANSNRIEKKKPVEPLNRNPVQTNRYQKQPEIVRSRKDTLKVKPKKIDLSKSITLYDPTSKEFHPYPYITSPDAFLLTAEDDEDQKPPPPLSDEIAERIMLDTAFAKSYTDELIGTLLESHIRDIVKTFTMAQGPANKPGDKSKNSTATSGLTPSSIRPTKLSENELKAEPAYETVCEALITEEIKTQLRLILWNSLDEQAIFLDKKTYEKILSNDRGYTVNPELLPVFQRHAIEVGQGLRRNKKPVTDYGPFKGLPTKSYIYQFHKMWLDLMTSDNYAERELRLKFCNEAIWNYFYAEALKSGQQAIKDIDKEEAAKRTLSPYSSLQTASASSDLSSQPTQARSRITVLE